MKQSVIFLLILLCSTVLQASELSSATIVRLMFDRAYGEKLYIELDSHQESPVACHTNSSWEFVLDTSDELGKKMYSSLLLLYATGKQALFRGTESCDLHSNLETLGRIEIK